MGNLVLVALGGSLGAVLRYVLTISIAPGSWFPWGTFAVNIAGSLLIGLVWGASQHQDWFHEWGRLFLITGLLGGFTTYSAFAFDTVNLLHADRSLAALGYLAGTAIGCVGAAWLGHRLVG